MCFKEKLRLTKKCINNVKGNFEPGKFKGAGAEKNKKGHQLCEVGQQAGSQDLSTVTEKQTLVKIRFYIIAVSLFILC